MSCSSAVSMKSKLSRSGGGPRKLVSSSSFARQGRDELDPTAGILAHRSPDHRIAAIDAQALASDIGGLEPSQLQLFLVGIDQLELTLKFGQSLIVAGGGGHLVMQCAEPLVESGNLLFESGKVLLGLPSSRA